VSGDHVVQRLFLSVDSCSLAMKLKPVSGLHNVQCVDAENNRLGSFDPCCFGYRIHAAGDMAF
jgi:hypothetical protein